MQVASQNAELLKAYGIIQTLSVDASIRSYAEMREKALRDQMACEDGAYDKGYRDAEAKVWREANVKIADARNSGALDAQKNNARQMLNDNLPHSAIAKYSGLSIDEVEALAAQLQ